MAETLVEDYRSSLSELSFNSKPHINMLTMLAEDNIQYADKIVDTIVAHINSVPPNMKLPGMYLVDSVIKNIGGLYVPLFSSHLAALFTSVFEKVEESTRSQLYKLRLTWKEILPNNVLHHLDTQIRLIDPAWPVIATEPPKQIHVNPKFLGSSETEGVQANKQIVLEETSNEREKCEIKKKQLEVIKELEEKKERLRKSELALRDTLEKPKDINIVPHAVVQPVFNTRDPRLKRTFAASGQAFPSVKSFIVPQPNSGALQSVVVVPNAKSPNVNGVKSESIVSDLPQIMTNNENSASNERQENKNDRKTLSPNKKQKTNDLSHKSKNTSVKRKLSKDTNIEKNSDESKGIQFRDQNYDKSTSLKSQNENSRQYNRGRSLSPLIDKEHETQNNQKMKQTSPKSKLSSKKDTIQRVGIQESKHLKKEFVKRQPLGQDRKRGKDLLLKYKSNNENEPARKKKKEILLKNQNHVQSTYLFGNEDTDYRSLEVKNPENDFSKKSAFFFAARGNSHSSQYKPNYNIHETNERERLHKGKYSYYIDRVMHNPYTVMRQAEEKYNSGRISKIDYQDLCQNIKEMMENEELYNCYSGMTLPQHDGYPKLPQTDFKYSTKEGCNADSSTLPLKSIISSEPAVKSFKLDDKMRNIYFVDKRAFTLMNDIEPRELIFDGPPRNVFIEGLVHPLKLGFNGHSTEFEMGGRIHTVQFGVPGREIYVNSVPFEASFGGPSFVALLGDGKLHRIRIDGPSPRVLTSQNPAYELFEKFRDLHPDIQLPQITNSISSTNEKIDSLRDIDMRLKNSNNTKSMIYFDNTPSTVKDVDWRQIAHPKPTHTAFDLPKSLLNANYLSVKPELQASENSTEGADKKSSSDWNNKLLCPPEAKSAPPLKPPPLGPFLNPELISNNGQRMNLPEPSFSIAVGSSSHPKMGPEYKNDAVPPAVSTQLQPVTVSQQISNAHWQPLLPPPPFLGSIPGSEKLEQSAHQAVSLTLPTVQVPPLPVPESSIVSSISLSSDLAPTEPPSSPAPKMNVELFLEKLIAAGIIGKKKSEPTAAVTADVASSETSIEEVKEAEEETVPTIELIPKGLREYHPVVINLLYKGSQCATCGMRFKEIQSEHYSRHLDWHFRTNRREKDGAKKPLSRRLFYEVKDWVDFKEFEDFEERAPSYFELQASGEQLKEEEGESIQSVISIRCETEVCAVCGEQFQLFWVEEEEEWHLKHAVRHSEQVYHPACYEDFCKASEKPASNDNDLEDSVIIKSEPEDKMEVEVIPTTVKQESADVNSSETNVCENLDSTPTGDNITTSETAISVKTEPIEEITMEQSSVKEETSTSVVKSETPDTSTSTPSEPETSNSDESTNKENTVEITSESSQTDAKITVKEESDDEMEFRPPTPDPNFNNLPPVSKGTELSALCCIM